MPVCDRTAQGCGTDLETGKLVKYARFGNYIDDVYFIEGNQTVMVWYYDVADDNHYAVLSKYNFITENLNNFENVGKREMGL